MRAMYCEEMKLEVGSYAGKVVIRGCKKRSTKKELNSQEMLNEFITYMFENYEGSMETSTRFTDIKKDFINYLDEKGICTMQLHKKGTPGFDGIRDKYLNFAMLKTKKIGGFVMLLNVKHK